MPLKIILNTISAHLNKKYNFFYLFYFVFISRPWPAFSEKCWWHSLKIVVFIARTSAHLITTPEKKKKATCRISNNMILLANKVTFSQKKTFISILNHLYLTYIKIFVLGTLEEMSVGVSGLQSGLQAASSFNIALYDLICQFKWIKRYQVTQISWSGRFTLVLDYVTSNSRTYTL